MESNIGGVSVWNPDKQLSEQITLKNIVSHDIAMNLARTGVPELQSEKPLSFNDRISLRFKGLNEVISSQQCIITNTKAIVKVNSLHDWKKKFKNDEDKLENKFEEEDNDYNELSAILFFLDKCEQEIIKARQTKKLSDDFVWEKEDKDGDMILELTPNFFKMIKELENSYETIYCILINNKIVSSGVTVDEEMEDKEKEEEAMRRIIDS